MVVVVTGGETTDRKLTHLDLFSGYGGFSLAFERAGYETVAFSEIEPFPCKVLAHRWPDVPNLGDVSKIDPEEVRERFGHIDVITFGSPCQGLSVAGKRKGFEDDRSGLFHEAIRVIAGVRPTFALWENVPGVLSSAGGHDFAAALDSLAECGAVDIAWRILDAKHAGVPQRRRRVFALADFGGFRTPQILPVGKSLPGDFAKGRETGKEAPRGAGGGVAGTLGGGSGQRGWADDTDRMTFIPEVGGGITARYGKGADSEATDTLVGTFQNTGHGWWNESPVAGTIRTPEGGGSLEANVIAHALTAEGYDASEDGTGRGTPLVPTPFDTTQRTSGKNYSNPKPGDPCHPLAAGAHPPAAVIEGAHGVTEMPIAGSVQGGGGKPGQGYQAINTGMAVRRLTPTECEKLQGVPPGHVVGVPGATDSACYRALGNGVAVPVVEWLAHRMRRAS